MTTKFKAGDRVKLVGDSYDNWGLTLGSVHPISRVDNGGLYVRSVDGQHNAYFVNEEVELVIEKPKGTFENLIVESLPQGGYTVTAPGRAWGNQPHPLAAFTTADEALKFIRENIK